MERTTVRGGHRDQSSCCIARQHPFNNNNNNNNDIAGRHFRLRRIGSIVTVIEQRFEENRRHYYPQSTLGVTMAGDVVDANIITTLLTQMTDMWRHCSSCTFLLLWRAPVEGRTLGRQSSWHGIPDRRNAGIHARYQPKNSLRSAPIAGEIS